jgi:acyl-CoA thioester hydrolase
MPNLLNDCPVIIEIPIAWGEMDAFQHVNNVAYFRYFESARIAYFAKLDLLEFMNQTGIGPILKSTHCTFKIPLTYPDTISVGARVSTVKEDRFVMRYRVASHRHAKIAAEGEGVLVTFNYIEKQKVPVPEALHQKIQLLEHGSI